MIKLYDKDMNEVTVTIDEYIDKIFPLDNFSSFGLKMNDVYFQTSEHAFQYLKFIDTNKEIANMIKDSSSPYDARNIAHDNKDKRTDNWSTIKYINMEKVLRLKVEQNKKVKECLINTKEYNIVEKCVDEDRDWGLDNNNQGENNLGNIWMKIREDIIKEVNHE